MTPAGDGKATRSSLTSSTSTARRGSIAPGNFHSEQLHVVERWSFLDANTIQYRATLEDPAVYTRPWSLSVILHRHREPNFQLIENYCYTLDYDKFYPVPVGQ